MREIIPRLLWVGNAGDIRDVSRLLARGVTSLVDLALEELPPKLPRETIYLRFPLLDGAGNAPELLSAAIEATVSLVRTGVPALVYCGAGMSRSPAIVAAGLAILQDDAPETCLQRLTADHPHDVSPALWADVRNAYVALHGRGGTSG